MTLKTRAVCLHRLLKDFLDVQAMRRPAVLLPPALRDGNTVFINSHSIHGRGTSALAGELVGITTLKASIGAFLLKTAHMPLSKSEWWLLDGGPMPAVNQETDDVEGMTEQPKRRQHPTKPLGKEHFPLHRY